LTANFNSLTTFTETGLPAGTTWNVVYNGVTVYNSPAPNDANVVFDEPWWGNDAFTVPDQGSYIPTPASGNLNEGKTQSISFAASACYISISNTVVDFGQINSGSNVPTANTVTVTDNGGSAAANILVAGGLGSTSPFNGIWLGTSSANQIGIANTLWSAASQGSYSGTAVTNTPVDTMILIPNPGGGTASNTIYFGMGIPGGTPADTYTTNIIVESTC
ncbi:MAG: hypothetical protein KGH94_00005, partial [Candidatus Micrarchaeota archaeon]|nr:hypothetical protein [Candidatus Micrarchaeota archaeon]